MIRTLPAIVLTLAGFAVALRADDKAATSRGPEPKQATARIDDKGRLAIRQIEFVPEIRQRTFEADGVVKTVSETVLVPCIRETSWDSKNIEVLDMNGKSIDSKRLAELLKKETPVLISTDGNKVDPFYLKSAKEGTLIFILPNAKTDKEKAQR